MRKRKVDQSPREKKLMLIPSSMRSAYKKSSTSRTAAVKAMCQECTGYDRITIRECSAPACPLFVFRPYQKDDESDDVVEEK